MKKSILNLGKALNKVEQKNINGGNVPCNEWCADPDLQEMFWKPLYCSCNNGNSGNTGGGSGGGGNNEGPGRII